MAKAEGENEQEEARQKSCVEWRFAYEALTHVHSLRLFLFNPAMSLPLRCAALRAYLHPSSPFSASPVVLCEWKSDEGYSHRVYVPMPFCLIDHSVPFVAVAHSDYIEVKLKLFSFGGSFLDGLSFLGFSAKGVPVENGDIKDSRQRGDAPLPLHTDGQVLKSLSELSFYCRNCSARLTNSTRRVEELPSTDWRELAEYWYGTCCCPDRHKQQSLLNKFEETIIPKGGACIVGSTTCTFHPLDIVTGVSIEGELQTLKIGSEPGCIALPGELSRSMCFQNEEKVDLHGTADENSEVGTGTSSVTFAEPEGDSIESSCGDHTQQQDVDESESAMDQPKLSVVSGDIASVEEELVPLDHSCGSHCGNLTRGGMVDGGQAYVSFSSQSSAVGKLGTNGFMAGMSAASSSLRWTPLYCYACSSIVGASPGDEDEGVQLFKCHISTDKAAGGTVDLFRHHTLERVFCSELLSNTQENSSYRYVIRGLNTKLPMLQLVLINNESWNSSGVCLGVTATRDGHSGLTFAPIAELSLKETLPAFLEPVVKVTYSDCSNFSTEDLMAVEEWADRHHADDIYMLEDEINTLTEILVINRIRIFPESSGIFQQHRISFLTK